MAETHRLRSSGSYLQVRNLADNAYKDIQASIVLASSYLMAGQWKHFNADMLAGPAMASDQTEQEILIHGSAAFATATTNKVGGNARISGGVGDGAGGQTGAHGGDALIHGGAAASDLASSNGGDVILYGGANGSSGNDGSVKIGDSAETNYVGVATDGTLTLYGTSRKAKHEVIANAALGKGATAPTEVVVGNYTVWEFGLNDDAVLDWEVLSDWAPGTDVEVHIHWQINEAYAAASGEVQWQATWSACPHDETEALDSPTHTGTLDSGDQNIPTNARELAFTNIGTIPGASLSAEDSIGLILKRVALDAGTDPTAEPGVLFLEFHYTVDKFGE